jgi:type VI secretion system secreted protein VgrG
VADGVALQAQNDLTTAYNQAAGLALTATLTGTDLGGLTLTPGVYFFSSSAQLTGKLTLNGEGLADPVFVFQIGSTLTTAPGSSVVTINDGDSSTPGISVFWQVGSSATLGTGTAFEGNILALTSITADTGATVLDGRLLARKGAVTLDGNNIMAPPAEVIGGGGGGGGNVPDTGSTLLLLGFGVATLFAFKALSAWQRSGSLIAGGPVHPAI